MRKGEGYSIPGPQDRRTLNNFLASEKYRDFGRILLPIDDELLAGSLFLTPDKAASDPDPLPSNWVHVVSTGSLYPFFTRDSPSSSMTKNVL